MNGPGSTGCRWRAAGMLGVGSVGCEGGRQGRAHPCPPLRRPVLAPHRAPAPPQTHGAVEGAGRSRSEVTSSDWLCYTYASLVFGLLTVEGRLGLVPLIARLLVSRGRGVRGNASASLPADATSRMESTLLTILQLVNTWLQHAEAKNAGLVALTAVGTSGILAHLATEQSIPRLLLAGLLVTSLLLLLSLGVAVLSFLPRSDPAKLRPKGTARPAPTDNLYFYGDLGKYQPDQLASSVALLYHGIPNYDPSRHRSHTDLADQIINNSRITVSKNDRFRTAAWLTILALASAVVFSVLTLLICR